MNDPTNKRLKMVIGCVNTFFMA